MTTDTLDLADKIAMGLGGGLIILAIPIMGFLTTIAGSHSPLYTYKVMENGEAVVKHGVGPAIPAGAEIVTSPLFGPNMRAGLVLLGLLVFAVYGAYKAFAVSEVPTEQRSVAPTED